VFNTPSHPRVHHGRDQQYLDRNSGGILIIWDRLFGTFQAELFARRGTRPGCYREFACRFELRRA
jgi:sterol desaturase/sphingolipid hydroxylase (fatty acid hydroxylase superfamily)